MLTAEKWYQQQENYVKYGIDLCPPKSGNQVLTKSAPKCLRTRDKAKLLLLIILIGILSIAGVICTAYASQVNYNINELATENAIIQGEIENLDVKVEEANNIKSIEEKALTELGMVYPEYEQMVFIAEKSEKLNDFASVLREQAYN